MGTFPAIYDFIGLPFSQHHGTEYVRNWFVWEGKGRESNRQIVQWKPRNASHSCKALTTVSTLMLTMSLFHWINSNISEIICKTVNLFQTNLKIRKQAYTPPGSGSGNSGAESEEEQRKRLPGDCISNCYGYCAVFAKWWGRDYLGHWYGEYRHSLIIITAMLHS